MKIDDGPITAEQAQTEHARRGHHGWWNRCGKCDDLNARVARWENEERYTLENAGVMW